ncbi:3'3'-cGAMP-specific phosphodiesterase 2 [Candidatus Magnetaquicoccaceae bacterium FCR-1]|uniref:3'3'-cGAMP-specific phosphodiesterase 2 n=1 Tax=Candidatus Magnetaquiglobus chichijimensis TaxID=3141448 RepID=A0ABQ0C4R0_9PROT
MNQPSRPSDSLLSGHIPSRGGPVAAPPFAAEGAWKIMVIDDDPDLHPLTRLVLKDLLFDGRRMSFIHGYSGADARRLMVQHPDTAVLLLDVMMESDREGLEVVRYIRDTLENPWVRIILRTGQPGLAPEAEVIAAYDINDYKDKVNLSNQSLITSVTAGLRAFKLLDTIEKTRRGMHRVIDASGSLYEFHSMGQLAQTILEQFGLVINPGQPATDAFAATLKHGVIRIHAATGQHAPLIGQPVDEVLSSDLVTLTWQALRERRPLFSEQVFIGYFRTRNGLENLLLLDAGRRLSEVDRDLIELFSANVTASFEQLLLHREIIATQKDVTFTLGEVIETRSGEAGQHVRRVAENSRLLAQFAGLPSRDCELLRMASPMHDLGKIGIPDAILNKPGSLTDEEWRIMRSHTQIGHQVLGNSDQPIIRTGAIISLQHHEKWDGTGYPNGLAGEAIHIFARITSLIDVFDALTHKRTYKPAWSIEKAVGQIRKDRGTHFDPELVDLFLTHLDGFLEIQQAFE